MFNKNIGDLFKQAKDMQSKVAEIQEELAKERVEATTGGGMVHVVASGTGEVLSINIDEELINMQDKAILEDLVAGAMNEVRRKVIEGVKGQLSKFTGGLPIPGLFT